MCIYDTEEAKWVELEVLPKTPRLELCLKVRDTKGAAMRLESSTLDSAAADYGGAWMQLADRVAPYEFESALAQSRSALSTLAPLIRVRPQTL
jgi:hypothetical protein